MSSSYSSQFKQDAIKLAVESDQSVAWQLVGLESFWAKTRQVDPFPKKKIRRRELVDVDLLKNGKVR